MARGCHISHVETVGNMVWGLLGEGPFDAWSLLAPGRWAVPSLGSSPPPNKPVVDRGSSAHAVSRLPKSKWQGHSSAEGVSRTVPGEGLLHPVTHTGDRLVPGPCLVCGDSQHPHQDPCSLTATSTDRQWVKAVTGSLWPGVWAWGRPWPVGRRDLCSTMDATPSL